MVVSMSDETSERPRRPLRETVCDIDREILKLVLQRHNLVARMASARGRLSPQEERYLRESWESQVARVSADPNLSTRFFTLLQEVEFLPKPSEEAPQRRTAFGLAPIQKPVHVLLEAPKDQEQTQLWAALAATTGQPLRIGQVLMNDAVSDCVRMFNQFGCALHRDDGDVLSASTSTPAATPDKILHVGDSAFNFYLAVALYLGRPSHAKFSGGPTLKLADFSALRHFLPSLGARLISLVPRNDGLPVRIESSGLLPDVITLTADLPLDFVTCLIAAAPFYQKELTIDYEALAGDETEDRIGRTLDLLAQSGISCTREGMRLHFVPGTIELPAQPGLGMDLRASTVLLALAAVNGGEVSLNGLWPQTPATAAVADLFAQLGLELQAGEDHVSLKADPSFRLNGTQLTVPAALPAELAPLPFAFACIQALRYGQASLPAGLCSDPDVAGQYGSFARACGLDLTDEGLRPWGGDEPASTPAWTAPSPMWACALALAACARPASRGFFLNNPGILTELYPAFWTLYNALPEPGLRRVQQTVQPARERRRIITQAVAQLTPRPEDED